MQLSYTYLNQVISKMVHTDARFKITTKPVAEVVAFFQILFIRLLEKWIRIYPDDFLNDTESSTTQNTHLATIVHEIEKEYDISTIPIPFIYAFFKDALRLCKKNVSSPLYEDVLVRSLIDERSKRLTYFAGSDKIAVIVDPRYDALMEAVIRNFMHFLKGWNLMIFSAAVHKERIVADFPTCLFEPIADAWMTHGDTNMTVDAYNHILLSKAFWQSIPATHIAIFQKDCVMYKMFDESLFLSYDFAGANYFHDFAGAPLYGGINGGFSLRNKKAMIECIERVSWEAILEYNRCVRKLLHFRVKQDYHLETRNEDVFFTNACEILGKSMPDVIVRNLLAIEVNTSENRTHAVPSVYHGWNKNYHDLDTAKTFLSASPFFIKYIHNVSD